jgi:hypothetical protein
VGKKNTADHQANHYNKDFFLDHLIGVNPFQTNKSIKKK